MGFYGVEGKRVRYEMSKVRYCDVVRWSIALQLYDFTVKHKPGKLNVVPDTAVGVASLWCTCRPKRVQDLDKGDIIGGGDLHIYRNFGSFFCRDTISNNHNAATKLLPPPPQAISLGRSGRRDGEDETACMFVCGLGFFSMFSFFSFFSVVWPLHT